jgi:predicted metal-dependent hydrolase
MGELSNRKIIRSWRKTVSLEISRNGVLIIRAPVSLPDEDIDYIISRYKDWIRRKLSYIKNLPGITKKVFISGEKFFYLGEEYELKIFNSNKRKLYFDVIYFYLSKPAQNSAKKFFVNWYKRESLRILSPVLKSYSRKCGISYSNIKITSANKRWGSCSKINRLNFSYRIAMLPSWVVNYIAVHELCHIVEHNHSRAFWKKVEVVLPDYRKADRWIKENGYLFHI